MATNLKKTVVQAANRAAKRRGQRRQSIQDWVDARPQRVKKRQGRRTAITRIRQKGKQARKGFRSTTRDLKKRRTRPTASEVIASFAPTDIGFDEIADFAGFGGGMSGFEIDETITQKTWFWPAVIGSVGVLILVLRKPKKKKKKKKDK